MSDMTVNFGGNEVQVITSQAGVALDAALRAELAKSNAALSASTAEAVSGPTYASTAAGLAATTNGQSFAVDNGNATVTIYRNNAGVAVAQRTLATSAALTANGGAGLVGTTTGLTVQASLDQKRAFPRNNKVAFLGDSITAQGIDISAANEIRFTNRGFTHWVPFLTMQRFVSSQALNFGVSGQNTAQIATRVGDVVASGAGTCVVLAGTNDIGGLTFAQTTANLATIYEVLAKAGIHIIALPILPRTLTTEAQYSFPQRVNEWIKQQASNYAGFKYIDPFVFGEPYSLTYSPRAGYTYDGLHPMAIGAFTLADPIAAHLNTILPEPGAAIRSVCDYYNTSNPRGFLNTNGMLAGTAGTAGPAGAGVTGSIANSHRVQAFAGGGSVGSLTVTCSKAASTLTYMENQKIVVAGTATGGFDTSVIFDCTVPLSNISAGDTIELIADVEIPSATIGISGVEAYLAVQQNGTYKYAKDGYAVVSDDYIWKAIGRGTFRTPPLNLSGTIGGSIFGIKINLKNTGTTRSIDLRVNNLAVRKVV